MPGRSSDWRSRSTGGVITPRSSASSGSPSTGSSSAAAACSNSARPGPRFHDPRRASSSRLGHGPVGDEPAEVVDPREVEHLERPPQPLGPPAVADGAAAPASRTTGCPTAGPVSEYASGGTPATRPVLEQLRMSPVVGRPRRHVDRDVAHQAHAAVVGVRRAARVHSRWKRTWSAIAPRGPNFFQSAAQKPCGSMKSSSSDFDTGAAGVAEQPRRSRERGRRLVRRPVAVRRAQRQHLPPRLTRRPRASRRTCTRRARACRSAGKLDGAGRRWFDWTLVCDFGSEGFIRSPYRILRGVVPTSQTQPTARADPDPVPGARRRRRPLPGQTLHRRHRRRLGGHLPRRARQAARRRQVPRAEQQGLAARLRSRAIDKHVDGVRWAGEFPVDAIGRWEYDIEAWTDVFGTWRDELERKIVAGQHDLSGELSEGTVLLKDTLTRTKDKAEKALIEHALAHARGRRRSRVRQARRRARPRAARRDREERRAPRRELPAAPAARSRSTASARASAPGTSSSRAASAASRASRQQLPRLAELGFDVLYLPPIHPIGKKNRKGRNNSLTAGPTDPGSPWAIGSPEGGHDAVHPELGTIDDLKRAHEGGGRATTSTSPSTSRSRRAPTTRG